MKHILSIVFLISNYYASVAQNGFFSGRVVDAKTNEPLAGAAVQIVETPFGASTNMDGKFIIQDVPPKTYNIQASFIGYESLIKFNVVIRSEGNIDVNFELNAQAQELEGIIVTANPFFKIEETPLSIQKLSQEEVAAYPGGNNDIAR